MDTTKTPSIAELASNLHGVSSSLGRVADLKLQELYGFGMSQFKIMWVLNEHQGGILQTTIASWLNQTEAAISRQINLMKDEDLVKQRTDPKNHRNHIIVLSSKGRKLAVDAMAALVKEYRPAFSVLNKEEQVVLSSMLRRIFLTVCKDASKKSN